MSSPFDDDNDEIVDRAQLSILVLEMKLRRLQRTGQALIDALPRQAWLSQELQLPVANFRAALEYQPRPLR